jgi:glycosyltransferase involved in cell wall biosynthesis
MPDQMKKGLFVAFEGIDATIFDSQVALHAIEMKEHGVETEIWVFDTRKSHYAESLRRLPAAQQLARSKIRLFRGSFQYLPFSGILNSFLLLYHLMKDKPDVDFIHARADYASHVYSYLAPFMKIPLIWDCRGDYEAEFALAYSPRNFILRILKWALIRLFRWRTHHAGRNSSGAVFVSIGLWERKKQNLTGQPFEIIPCGVSGKHFFFSEKLRNEIRSKWGYTDEDRVLIYSGGVVAYQGFGEYVSLFKLMYDMDKKYKFLVVTPYTGKASAFLRGLPLESYKLLSASFDEMNSLYNAADFGMLLRPPNPVNFVASPTKFGEYCLSGLPIIMNETVEQSWKIAQDLGNCIPYGLQFDLAGLVPYKNETRKSLAKASRTLLSRDVLAQKYISLYTKIIEHAGSKG